MNKLNATKSGRAFSAISLLLFYGGALWLVWTFLVPPVFTFFEKVLSDKFGPNPAQQVFLDATGAAGTVGISNAIGRIDLRDVWSEILKSGEVSQETINILRNRCVVPLLEKIDASGGNAA